MKKHYLLSILTILTTSAFAQIPNGSFEDWSGQDPQGWASFNLFIPGAVVSTTPAYEGQKAARINTIDFFGTISPGAIITGSFDNSFIRTIQSSNKVTFWYKFNNGGTDVLVSYVGTKNTGSNDETESGNIVFVNTTVFTQAIIDLPENNFDSIAVGFIVNTTDTTDTTAMAEPSLNSFAIIDDVKFATSVSLADVEGFDFFESVYPTPSNEMANLVYSLNKNSKVIIRIYNLEGKLIEQVLQADQAPGRYRAEVNTLNYANGVYIAEIVLNGQVSKQKMIVAH